MDQDKNVVLNMITSFIRRQLIMGRQRSSNALIVVRE